MNQNYIRNSEHTVGEMIEILKNFPTDAKVGIKIDSGWNSNLVTYSGNRI